MKDLTKYQKRQLRKLAKEVRVMARVIDVCSDADIKYTLESLAIDLKSLKKEVTTLEEFAIDIAFEAVHNNQNQEA